MHILQNQYGLLHEIDELLYNIGLHSIDYQTEYKVNCLGRGDQEYKFPNIELVKVLHRNLRCPSGIQKEYLLILWLILDKLSYF